jgi:siroheme synthase (precorrin-2 oxidase/ferrochelatase)
MTNPLYPAFFRLDRLQILVVGAGEVGEEKLSFILKSSPNARVVIVAPWMGEELKKYWRSTVIRRERRYKRS